MVCGRYAAGEFDLGCIGISTALHLAAPMVRSHPGSLPLDALVHLTHAAIDLGPSRVEMMLDLSSQAAFAVEQASRAKGGAE